MLRSRSLTSLLLVAVSLGALMACSPAERDEFGQKAKNITKQDREIGYDREDFHKAMAPRNVDPNSIVNAGQIPELAQVIAEEKKNILPQPLVSITVNQDVPLREIFYELAQQAEVDLELDPTITGSIIFTAYNRPFDQVVERISELAGLRFKFKNNVLRVERDTPYLKTYKVDYLGMTRSYTSTVTSNTSAAAGSSGGGSNGSSSNITTQSNADFWGDLETNITQIIQNTNQQVSLTDQSTPIAATPQAIAAVSTDQLAGDANAAPAAPPSPAGAAAVTTPTAGLLNPTGTQTAAASAAGGAAGGAGAAANPYYSVNRQAGLVNIFATEKQHNKVVSYLSDLRRATTTQVLIEAKVFEVELNDESATGIDWSILSGGEGFGTNLPRQSFFSNAIPNPATGLPFALPGGTLNLNMGDIDLFINALGRFGSVRTLSSPRLTVLNNQTAVLNVSESRVFFDIEINRTEASLTTPGRTDITSEARNVPEGLIMSVHPNIDVDTKEIMMNLRPSITRVVRTVEDPGVAFAGGSLGISNPVPELSVREIDSVVRMKSGEVIIMGGLMQDRNQAQNINVPLLSDIPFIGNALFSNKLDGIRKTEMVIMLRAVVVDSASPDRTDRELYNTMGGDRRPFPQ